MKALFTAFLSISLSGSLILCLVLLLRLVFRKAPKTLICILWALAIFRLLLPFQIETPFSLRPETPVLTTYDTQFFAEPEPVPIDSLPSFVPYEETGVETGMKTVVVDYVMIAATVWAAVAGVMLLYMAISYLWLKWRLRMAIKTGADVYACTSLSTAFLLGYFRPRIYLPFGIDGRERELVIAHECMHKKRGDNWLKLFGFICLAVHWFNPLVWISYMTLCRDIEDACDEQVIRNLEEEDRKTYSTALLACAQKRRYLTVCPVAFGEISIKQRILNVLNYRKPTTWICVVAVIAIVLTTVLFMTDPLEEKFPPYYNELTQMLGQPMDTVVENLGLPANSVVMKPGNDRGRTPIQVEYQGVKFDLYLYTDRPGGEKFAYFAYVATYDDLDQGAEDTVKLTQHFMKSYGECYREEENKNMPVKLSNITVEEVREMFNNPRRAHVGISDLTDDWDLTEQGGSAAKSYLAEYEASEAWQLSYGPEGKFKDERAFLQWGCKFTASSDADPDSNEDTEQAHIAIIYRLAIKREPNGSVYYTFH